MTLAAMKAALEALTEHGAPYLRHGVDWDNAITALRAAIAEQEKCEPWGWALPADRDYTIRQVTRIEPSPSGIAIPLYTHPAPVVQGKCEPVAWRQISDAQWVNLVNHAHAWEDFSKDEAVHEVVKMTEAKCGENNTHPAPVPAGAVVITTTESGECVAVTRQDEEGMILKVLWEKS